MPIPLSVEVIVGVLALCLFLKCRGDCWSFDFVPILLSEEVIVVWLSALSLLCEVIVVVSSLLCRVCFVGERVVYS